MEDSGKASQVRTRFYFASMLCVLLFYIVLFENMLHVQRFLSCIRKVRLSNGRDFCFQYLRLVPLLFTWPYQSRSLV